MPITARGDIPKIGDPAFDALLDRSLAPEDAPAGLRPLAESFAALEAAEPRSTPGAEASALAVFRSAVAKSGQAAHRRARSRPVITRLRTARAAAVTTAAAVVLGGTAAAAVADKLPAPAQKFAHDVMGAPTTPPAHPMHVTTPQASSLPGHSAFGLCNAWASAKSSGNAAQKAVAFQRLEAAAGGAAQVSSFCASVTHPGDPATRPSNQTGKPSNQTGQGHPDGKPSTEPSPAQSHRDGKPSTLPSPAQSHPAGQPSDAPVG